MTAPVAVRCDRCGLISAADAQFCQTCGQNLQQQSASPLTAVPHYAGFWIRMLAFFIDWVVLGAGGYVVRPLIGYAVTFAHLNLGLSLHGFVARFSAALAINWIYHAGMESSRYQATLGKAIVGLKVTDLAGRRISFSKASIRHICRAVLGTLTLGIGFTPIGYDPKKQGFHDKLAGTLVLYR